MASQGPLFTATASNDNAVGVLEWGSPANAQGSCDTATSQAANDAQNIRLTNYIKGLNYGFSIPSGATIDGIVCTIRKNATASIASTTDQKVSIVKGGVVGSADKKLTGSWTSTLEDYNYGNSSDLWGETWTPADINASDFGVVLQASINNGNKYASANAWIDCISITVYYTEGGGGGEVKKVSATIKANVKKIGGRTAATVKKIGGKTF